MVVYVTREFHQGMFIGFSLSVSTGDAVFVGAVIPGLGPDKVIPPEALSEELSGLLIEEIRGRSVREGYKGKEAHSGGGCGP